MVTGPHVLAFRRLSSEEFLIPKAGAKTVRIIQPVAMYKDMNIHSYVKELLSLKNQQMLQLPGSRGYIILLVPPPLPRCFLCHPQLYRTSMAWSKGEQLQVQLGQLQAS